MMGIFFAKVELGLIYRQMEVIKLRVDTSSAFGFRIYCQHAFIPAKPELKPTWDVRKLPD